MPRSVAGARSHAAVFNLGEYRRRLVGTDSPAEFFHPDNDDARETRRCVLLEIGPVPKSFESS